jgi:hypothetical protein
MWLPLVAIGALLAAQSGSMRLPAAGDRVIRHVASEMPRLDVGVRQAVHVTFTGDREPAVGEPAQLRAVITSGAADADIEAELIAPTGAAITGGLARWSGRLDYQEVVEIPVAVVLPGDEGAFVRVQVLTRLADGQEFTSATSVYVDPGAPDSPAPVERTLIGLDGESVPVVIHRNRDQ